MSSDLALKLISVTKEYPLFRTRKEMLLSLFFPYRRKAGRFTALQPLSLEIKKGECVGVMGVNGSGKSTLLQIIAGCVWPTGGTVAIDGKIASLLELGSWINAADTGRENIYTAGYARNLSTAEIEAQMESIIDFAEIGEFIDQPVSTYSTGMLMRLAFATCTKLQADILLLDEVFAVGDARFSQKCIQFLREYIKNKTVLIVSHDVNIITMLCSRALLLDHGALVADGSPRHITERYLELCYGEKQSVTVQHAEKENVGEDIRPGGAVKVSGYAASARSFGEGGAEICDVSFCSAAGEKLSAVRGGEKVVLTIRAKALKMLELPAAGFVVRSPRGENLWGDSSQPGSIRELAPGKEMEVCFTFVLPRLENGVYSVGIAISTGELAAHHVQIWNHNALTFNVESAYPLLGAAIGLPMESITCRELP